DDDSSTSESKAAGAGDGPVGPRDWLRQHEQGSQQPLRKPSDAPAADRHAGTSFRLHGNGGPADGKTYVSEQRRRCPERELLANGWSPQPGDTVYPGRPDPRRHGEL